MDYDNNDQQQQQQQQQPYQYQQYQEAPKSETPMTLGQWMITLLILMIPVVNLVMLFVWGFSSNTPTTKANYCKASLIYAAIAIVLYILLVVCLGFSFVGSGANGYV